MDENNKPIIKRNKGKHKHICLMCAEPFLGRKNAKYCSLGCKNDCNNENNALYFQKVKYIDGILHKNRKLADGIANADNNLRSYIELLNIGYDLNFYTHQSEVTNDDKVTTCNSIYEYILVPQKTNPETFKIIFSDEY